MRKIVVVIPHSHTWLWTSTCLSTLKRFPPKANGFEVQIILVNNSPWSPSVKVATETPLGEGVTVWDNTKPNKFHASALDDVIDNFDFDYMMALETDVVALHEDWLQWFVDMIEDGGRFSVGHWHHERFMNPSCTIYRGSVLREMNAWCKANTSHEMRWGPTFEKVMLLNPGDIAWVAGPFADKRGFPEGSTPIQRPSGQEKGFGWYEPGQMLFHWATNQGYPYMVCNTAHTETNGAPSHTLYGKAQNEASQGPLELHELWGRGYTAHLWGGTRALDILKHPVSDQFVQGHTDYWLQREARFFMEAVSKEIRDQITGLIKAHRWHTSNIRGGPVEDRDIDAANFVESIYRKAGLPL